MYEDKRTKLFLVGTWIVQNDSCRSSQLPPRRLYFWLPNVHYVITLQCVCALFQRVNWKMGCRFSVTEVTLGCQGACACMNSVYQVFLCLPHNRTWKQAIWTSGGDFGVWKIPKPFLDVDSTTVIKWGLTFLAIINWPFALAKRDSSEMCHASRQPLDIKLLSKTNLLDLPLL